MLAAPGLVFAAYLLVDGIVAVLVGAREAQHHHKWWPLVIAGAPAKAWAGVYAILFSAVIHILVATSAGRTWRARLDRPRLGRLCLRGELI
jgi:hypothetical protein